MTVALCVNEIKKRICPNELLIGDLNLMTPMLDPINNLRNNLYAFGTNIEGFFHNILVDVKDRGIFRFWFYKNEKMDELELLIFLAHIFGSSASPTVCSFVLIEQAHRIRDVISVKALKIISRFFYGDDGTGGSDKWVQRSMQ